MLTPKEPLGTQRAVVDSLGLHFFPELPAKIAREQLERAVMTEHEA